MNITAASPIKIDLQVPEFFHIPFRKMVIETNEITNRTYFLHHGRIVAVAIPLEASDAADK